MPDFTSHINLMPEDKITPAINDLTNTLMKVEMVKRAEDERKMARLTDLATFALGDMTNRDNADIQKMAEEFKNSLVPLYQQSEKNGMKGNLPYSVQADLNAKKQQIMRMAAKAEQDKKDFYELNKMMATNKDIDQGKTKRGVDAWYNEPIDKRGSIYSAVRLNFDVNEYFKKNIINDPKKWTELSGKNGAGTYDIERYAKEDVLGQMVDMYQNNPRLKQEVDDRMAEEGIKAKNIGDVKNAMDKWQWADKFVVDNMDFKQHNRTNIYNSIGGGDTNPGESATSTRTILNKLSDDPNIKNKGENVSLRIAKSTAIPGGDAKIVIKANNYFNLSEYKGPETTPEDVDINGGTVESMPVVWMTDKKGKNGKYYLADDKWLATHPEYEKKVEYKPYIVGQNEKTVKWVEDGKEKSQQQTYQYAIPADADNVNKLNANIPKTQPKFKLSDTEMDFSGNANVPVTNVDSQTWITTVKTLKEKYKWTPEQIAKYKRDNKIQVQ
jgi:hypothetical protein